MNNAELSECRNCGEQSTAILDEDGEPFCANCDSYWLIDMSDGTKFTAEVGD